MLQQKMPRLLEIDAVLLGKLLLHLLSDCLKSPDCLPDPVVFVYDIGGVRKVAGGNLGIRFIHITDEIFDAGTVIFLEIIA